MLPNCTTLGTVPSHTVQAPPNVSLHLLCEICLLNMFLQNDETVLLEIVDGQIHVKDQVQDYVQRGDPLEEWSYLDYFLGTYDGNQLQHCPSVYGCPRSTRVAYKNNYRPSHCQLVCSSGHETMPYFPGLWFPKKDENDNNGLFEASMLALLKPWRSVTTLKKEHEPFRTALEDFLSTASQNVHNTIANIQFFHECSEGAKQMSSFAAQMNELVSCEASFDQDQMPANFNNDEENEDMHALMPPVTEQQILHAIDHPFSAQEALYAETAIGIEHKRGLLSNKNYAVVS